MFSLCLIYDSDKRYIIPLETLEKVLTKDQIKKLKKEALKQVQQL